MDNISFDRTIQVVQEQKFNLNAILDRHKILPKMMLVVHPTPKIYVLKMEQAFQTGYREGDKVFYISNP